jgi:hypothetical protein
MNAISNRKTPRQPLIGVALLAVTCAVLTACGSSGSTRSASPPSASSPPATNGNANTPAPHHSPLEGTWRTGSVTVADMTAALSRAGLQKWIEPFRAGADLGHSNAFLLTIGNGNWHEGWSKDGGPFADIDDGTYRIAGDTVSYYPQGPSATYRWSIQGGTLRLTLLRDTDPGSGIPDQVYQRAHYTAAPFQRQK